MTDDINQKFEDTNDQDNALVGKDQSKAILQNDEDEGTNFENPAESPSIKGEESVSGSAPEPESDDSVEKMVEDVTGRKPKQGQTFGDIVNKEAKDEAES